jgi:hypothetical protein
MQQNVSLNIISKSFYNTNINIIRNTFQGNIIFKSQVVSWNSIKLEGNLISNTTKKLIIILLDSDNINANGSNLIPFNSSFPNSEIVRVFSDEFRIQLHPLERQQNSTVLNEIISSDLILSKQFSHYTLQSTLVIFDNSTLTIEPGVVLLMTTKSEIHVYGQLIINGTNDDFVVFKVDLKLEDKHIDVFGIGDKTSCMLIFLNKNNQFKASILENFIFSNEGNETRNLKNKGSLEEIILKYFNNLDNYRTMISESNLSQSVKPSSYYIDLLTNI